MAGTWEPGSDRGHLSGFIWKQIVLKPLRSLQWL